jgi:hypothetical protein
VHSAAASKPVHRFRPYKLRKRSPRLPRMRTFHQRHQKRAGLRLLQRVQEFGCSSGSRRHWSLLTFGPSRSRRSRFAPYPLRPCRPLQSNFPLRRFKKSPIKSPLLSPSLARKTAGAFSGHGNAWLNGARYLAEGAAVLSRGEQCGRNDIITPRA